ncbi:alpha/beta fold hydrolase, partial [Chloroflexota bacterium]
MKRGFADTPHGQIHYVTEGLGYPILCFHKTPTSWWDHAPILPILGKKYRTIAMDTLGYGDSDKPPHRYEISDYVQSVVDFLDVIGISNLTLVAVSTGSVIASEVAITHPERVDKLIIGGYPLYSQEELEQRKKELPITVRAIEPGVPKIDGSHLIAAWNWAKYTIDFDTSLQFGM